MTNNKTNDESGRSMVEVLGVLAIIGVLSVGGIAGYQSAMDKMTANTIADEVRKRAVVASQQRILGQSNIVLSDFYQNSEKDLIKDTHTVTAAPYETDTSFFTIQVSDIPKGVCDKLLDNKPRFSVKTLLGNNEISDTNKCADVNALTWIFANDLNESAALTGKETCPSIDNCASQNPTTCECNECDSSYPHYLGLELGCADCFRVFDIKTKEICTACVKYNGNDLFWDDAYSACFID